MSEKLTLTKLELLRMARELVINEYIDKRAQDHNAWIAQADVVWRTQGVRLAYPAFPQYPTEVDILARAQALNTFLSPEDQAAEKAAVEANSVATPTPATTPAITPTQTLSTVSNQSNVVDVKAEDVKDVKPVPTNYVSNPELYAEILKKQNQQAASIPGIPEPNEQPMSALDRLKNSLGLK